MGTVDGQLVYVRLRTCLSKSPWGGADADKENRWLQRIVR